jgi:hypothetical protein
MQIAELAPHFWAAVEDCLVTFHGLTPREAAERVTGFRRRLPTRLDNLEPTFSDMIYHAEPWQIACNLAEQDLPIADHEPAYREILKRSGLYGEEPALHER